MKESFALPQVKVCGITRTDDALVAARAGADAVGFIQHPPSPRSVPFIAAQRLAAVLPSPVRRVAVMVDATPEQASCWCSQADVHFLQLCGAARPADWRGFGLPLLRRIGVAPGAETEMDAWREVAAGFVLDHPSAAGGSGRTVDAAQAARLCALGPCLLAGGLDEHNVADAIRRMRPRGVDASSRLERAPGWKQPERVRAYVAAARAAFAEIGS